ncbi:hypothetical protein D3C80_2051820 [compost metagenome]
MRGQIKMLRCFVNGIGLHVLSPMFKLLLDLELTLSNNISFVKAGHAGSFLQTIRGKVHNLTFQEVHTYDSS